MDHRPLEDWEYPEPDEESDLYKLRACPACGDDIYEDAEQCPVCGEYVVFGNSSLSGWPWWFVALGLLGVFSVVLVLLWAF